MKFSFTYLLVSLCYIASARLLHDKTKYHLSRIVQKKNESYITFAYNFIKGFVADIDPTKSFPPLKDLVEGIYQLAINTPFMIGYELGLNEEPLGFKRSAIECSACKWGSWFAINTIGSDLSKDFFIGALTTACPYIVRDIGFEDDICDGMIKSQFKDSLVPIFFNDLIGEKVLCSF